MLLELNIIKEILGSDPKEYTVLQVGLRALVTYLFTIVIVKIGHKRFMGQSTTFDAVLGLILGSVMSRAINGQAAFFPTLLGGVILVAIHYVGAAWAFRSKPVADLLKGKSHALVKDGQFLEKELARHHVSRADIMQSAHLTANLDDIASVKEAILENSGQIGIVKKSVEQQSAAPRVLEIKVENGVQTVRIEFS